MISQFCHHSWRSILTRFRLQRPHRPAEVVTVHREERDRAMNPPVLREAIRLPHLPRVPVTVGTVVPLHECRVDPVAHPRFDQRRLHRGGGAEDHPRHHIHHPAFLPSLMHRGIMQPRRRHLLRAFPRPPPSPPPPGPPPPPPRLHHSPS